MSPVPFFLPRNPGAVTAAIYTTNGNTGSLFNTNPARHQGLTGRRRSRNQSPWRFLCVLAALAVKVRRTINREGAKSAKNLAKQNSFQESKYFRFSSWDLYLKYSRSFNEESFSCNPRLGC